MAIEKSLGDESNDDAIKHLIGCPAGREVLENGDPQHGLGCRYAAAENAILPELG